MMQFLQKLNPDPFSPDEREVISRLCKELGTFVTVIANRLAEIQPSVRVIKGDGTVKDIFDVFEIIASEQHTNFEKLTCIPDRVLDEAEIKNVFLLRRTTSDTPDTPHRKKLLQVMDKYLNEVQPANKSDRLPEPKFSTKEISEVSNIVMSSKVSYKVAIDAALKNKEFSASKKAKLSSIKGKIESLLTTNGEAADVTHFKRVVLSQLMPYIENRLNEKTWQGFFRRDVGLERLDICLNNLTEAKNLAEVRGSLYVFTEGGKESVKALKDITAQLDKELSKVQSPVNKKKGG
jgi:hypothetical protein